MRLIFLLEILESPSLAIPRPSAMPATNTSIVTPGFRPIVHTDTLKPFNSSANFPGSDLRMVIRTTRVAMPCYLIIANATITAMAAAMITANIVSFTQVRESICSRA